MAEELSQLYEQEARLSVRIIDLQHEQVDLARERSIIRGKIKTLLSEEKQ